MPGTFMAADSQEKRVLQENEGCLLLPGSFLLAHSRLGPRSGYVSRVIGPTLPGNMKYCLKFYFSLRGEWHSETLQIDMRWLLTISESCAVIYLNDSQPKNNSGNCRFQPDGAGPRCVSAAEQRPGEDLDSGGEVPRNLDRNRRDLPDITACQGQRRGSGNIALGRMDAHNMCE